MGHYENLSVVIIEDTPVKTQMLSAMLTQLGVNDIQTFERGTDALDALKRVDEQCLVFLDLMLPGLSGQEILQKLAQRSFKGFVVINSVCEQRIVQTALKVAASSGVRLLGALENELSLAGLEKMLKRCNKSQLPKYSHPNAVLLEEEEIYQAFDQDLVEPFYQPIINLNQETIVAIECLARIRKPGTNEFLTPVSFLPRIIDIAFLDNMTLRLFQKSLNYFDESELGESAVKLALNLEPSQLRSTAFPMTLHELARKSPISSDRFIFELTEQTPVNEAHQLETVNILRLKGYNIAIDDFGSGYTNISNLHSIPFNKLKVDRYLMENIHNDSFCQVALDSVVAMADEVNAAVILEGIENTEQLVYSSKYKDVCLQGNYLCEALGIEDLLDWIERSPYKLAS